MTDFPKKSVAGHFLCMYVYIYDMYVHLFRCVPKYIVLLHILYNNICVLKGKLLLNMLHYLIIRVAKPKMTVSAVTRILNSSRVADCFWTRNPSY